MNAVTPAAEAVPLHVRLEAALAAVQRRMAQAQDDLPADRLRIPLTQDKLPTLALALTLIQVYRRGVQNGFTADRLLVAAGEAESVLEALRLPKRARQGATFKYAASTDARTRGHPLMTTVARFRRNSRGWVLADLLRIKVRLGDPDLYDVFLTEEQAALLRGRLTGHCRFRHTPSGPVKVR